MFSLWMWLAIPVYCVTWGSLMFWYQRELRKIAENQTPLVARNQPARNRNAVNRQNSLQ